MLQTDLKCNDYCSLVKFLSHILSYGLTFMLLPLASIEGLFRALSKDISRLTGIIQCNALIASNILL